MSVYNKEDARHLEMSILSMLNQTIPPSQFLIVQDGPIGPELTSTLKKFCEARPGLFSFVRLNANRGLWKALDLGVDACSNELIMRMDSDDFSEPNRAEKQLAYMREHSECVCCGTDVIEFENDLDEVVSAVKLPSEHDDIVAYSKFRNPMRHPTLLYRKGAVKAVGGYQKMPYFEDYDLIVRLIASGGKLHNLCEPLVKMRVGEGFYERRGDFQYLGYMKAFRRACLDRGYVTRGEYLNGMIPHAIVCLLPNGVRLLVYRRLLRSKV